MRFLKILTIISTVIIVLAFGWNNLFISEQNREVASFNSIYTSGPINVYIQQADEESLLVRADTNIHDKVVVEVVKGELRIYTKGEIRHERVLDVYVGYKSLNEVHASGPSTITGRSFLDTSTLKIEVSVSAEVKLQVESNSLDLIMKGAANVQLAGSADHFSFLITDVGDLMAYNFISQHCKAIVDTGDQSPGIARINVIQTFDLNIKGPRIIKYKGDPIITNQIIEGTGKLIKH